MRSSSSLGTATMPPIESRHEQITPDRNARPQALNVHSSGCNPEKRSAPDRPTAQRLNDAAIETGRPMSPSKSNSTALRLRRVGITCFRVAPGAMHMAALRATRTRAESDRHD